MTAAWLIMPVLPSRERMVSRLLMNDATKVAMIRWVRLLHPPIAH